MRGTLESAARPAGVELRRAGSWLLWPNRYAKSSNLIARICRRYMQIYKMYIFDPPIIPPGRQRIPPG